jgi:DNA-binding CsgD family transcriptional regulator
MKPDLIGILEAAYHVEQDETAWLKECLDAARPSLDGGMGCSAFLYDASDPSQFRIWSFLGSSDGRDDAIVSAIRRSPPERIRWTFRSQACRVASEGPNWDEQPAAKLFRTWGVEDIFFVNGVDPLGVGCFFTAKLAQRRRSTARDKATWSRIAAHVASGYRLQRRLAAARSRGPVEDADAVLEPNGKVQHADDAAQSHSARQALVAAVAAADRARGSLRRTSPEEGIAGWRGLVAARWSLVDHVETDGRRYVLACRNEAALKAPELTSRERQALGYARLGHTNKLIAYEMGIAASTVGVLLCRAGKKLGVSSRPELLAAFERLLAQEKE